MAFGVISPHSKPDLRRGRLQSFPPEHVPMRPRARTRWLLGWPGLAALGVANGIARELLYADALGEQQAHQVSTASLIVLIVVFTWYLERRWPLPTRHDAVVVGVSWAILTIGFEFAFGHFVDGDSWSTLLAAYKIWNGELWPLVLLAIAATPAIVRRASRHREGG